jgi:hypothetical protein
VYCLPVLPACLPVPQGWAEMDKMREKLEDLKELRDLVRSLGRRVQTIVFRFHKSSLTGTQGLGALDAQLACAAGGNQGEPRPARPALLTPPCPWSRPAPAPAPVAAGAAAGARCAARRCSTWTCGGGRVCCAPRWRLRRRGGSPAQTTSPGCSPQRWVPSWVGPGHHRAVLLALACFF